MLQFAIGLIKRHTEFDADSTQYKTGPCLNRINVLGFICTTYHFKTEAPFSQASTLYYEKFHSLTVTKIIIWYKFLLLVNSFLSKLFATNFNSQSFYRYCSWFGAFPHLHVRDAHRCRSRQIFGVRRIFAQISPNFGTRKAEVLNSLIINTTAKALKMITVVIETFARCQLYRLLSPNLPERFCAIFGYKSPPQRSWRPFFGVIMWPKKKVFMWFSPNVGRHFLKSNNVGHRLGPDFA